MPKPTKTNKEDSIINSIKENIEHCELTQAIAAYNNGTATSAEIQRQLWRIWKFNCNVCVPVLYDKRTLPELAVLPTSNGNAYVFYTESKIICKGDRPFIIHLPFRSLLDCMYTNNSINSIVINPAIDNEMAIYSIGFLEELFKTLCRGEFLAI